MKQFDQMIRLPPEEKQELLDAMHAHFHTYLRARSLTPYIPKPGAEELGSSRSEKLFLVSTAPLYQNYGYSCHMLFDVSQFDTDEKYQQYQEIGHWINQSFLIELKSLLDSYIAKWKSCPLIDDEYYKLLRKFRNLFAHSSFQLGYKQRKGHKQDYDKALRLYKELFPNLRVAQGELDLSVDKFVEPLFRNLVRTIKEKL